LRHRSGSNSALKNRGYYTAPATQEILTRFTVYLKVLVTSARS
jgi:hypothetical protein